MMLDFNETYTLEDDRVILRPLSADDLTHLLPYSINEPELWTYSLIPADGEENLKQYIDQALKSRRNHTAYPFIVYDKQKQSYAGSTRFYDYQPEHKTTQLGFTWYGKVFHGTGLNKHCKYLMLSFAFERLNLERVEFRADQKNTRSIAAMKSIGCIPEGVLRQNCKSITGRRDSIILSILRSEWLGHVKVNLEQKL